MHTRGKRLSMDEPCLADYWLHATRQMTNRHRVTVSAPEDCPGMPQYYHLSLPWTWLERRVTLQVTTPQQQASSGSNGNKAVVAAEEGSAVAEVLENTLWNRQLGAMSEEIVAALVCQIFEGEHAVHRTE